MPITVKHGPVGTLGRLAVLAGQARGQEIRASRDIQITNMMLAAQDRAAALGAAATRDSSRDFAIQEAAAARIAKQRPSRIDMAQRQQLRRTISQAKTSGIYRPEQIKQMQIFADLGDVSGLRTTLGALPQASVRQRELERQSSAISEIGRRGVAELQKQLDTVNSKLEKRFSPEAQQFLRDNPRFAKPEIQELLDLQQQLGEQKAATVGQTDKMKQLLGFGLTIRDQMELERKEEDRIARQTATGYKRQLDLAQEAGKLSEREEEVLDVMRDHEQSQRASLGREITRLSKDLALFTDEDEDDHAERIKPVQAQIQQLRLEQMSSFAREKQKVMDLLSSKKPIETAKIVTDSNGTRWRATGRFRNGKLIYEEIE